MYGYIRPNRGELRVREYELFCAAYCGLCHTLRERYGIAARFAVNYDLTFLAMLLSERQPCPKRRRCIRHPLRGRMCVGCDDGFALSADCSVILAWWKLDDELRDGGLGRRLLAHVGRLLLRRSYRHACERRPELDERVRTALSALSALEAESSASIDRTADCFATVLAACAEEAGEVGKRRVLRELLYHVGRCIYLLDAADDLPEDVRSGSFNPLRGRCGDTLSAEDNAALLETITLSQNRVGAAFALLPATAYTPIIENIIAIGLPQMTELVLTGLWRKRKKLLRDKPGELMGDRV